MADTEKLDDMVDNFIHKKPEDAQVNFHDYLKTKMQDVVGGGPTGETDSDNKDNEE